MVRNISVNFNDRHVKTTSPSNQKKNLAAFVLIAIAEHFPTNLYTERNRKHVRLH